MTDVNSGKLSLSDLDLEYEPMESSGSITESGESMPRRRMRLSEEQATNSSTVHHPGEVVTTSNAVPLDESHSTSSGVLHHPPRIRAHTSLPEAPTNLLWLPCNLASASIPLFYCIARHLGQHPTFYTI